MLRLALGAVGALAATWLLFVLVLALWRPRGMDLKGAARLVPDVTRLVRSLAADATLPRPVRRRLLFLLAYLAFPVDVVPDFIPLLGYADDVIVVAVVLRSVVRAAGPDALERHWQGTDEGLALVRRLCRVGPPPPSPPSGPGPGST
ncbi:MAG: hypothetical protein QOK43_2342 [Acidimicrobiaceae bacterium]|nr:hypothetical protein [Acidimicrobiaceae bacterium]